MLNISNKVLIYGVGNSGYAAEEFQLRFMRIGMDVSAVTDSQIMKISAALAETDTLIIAISLSGESTELLESVRIAKEKGAATVCMTASPFSSIARECGEVIQVASFDNLNTGTKISPQFSILVVMDVLYSCLLYTSLGDDIRELLETFSEEEDSGDKTGVQSALENLPE